MDISRLTAFIISHIKNEKIDLDPAFVEQFMFSLDSKERFCIPLQKLVDWEVYAKKSKAKQALLTHFKEGEDFLPSQVKSSGGRPSQQFMLSTRCFKKICMTVHNPMGDKIQNYYLTLEELYKKYLEDLFRESQILLKNKDENIDELMENVRLKILEIEELQKRKSLPKV